MSRPRFGLDVIQVTAAVMAAVTGAILASDLGVAGTIVGTAVASFVGTTGSAIYRHYLSRTKERLADVAPVVVRRVRVHSPDPGRSADAGEVTALPSADGVNEDVGPYDRPTQVQRPSRPGGEPDDATQRMSPGPSETPAGPGQPTDQPANQPPAVASGSVPVTGRDRFDRRRWLMLGGVAAAVFVAVIVAVTLVEVGVGKPLDAAVWGHRATGTSVGDLVGGGQSTAVTPPASRAPTPTTTPTTRPSAASPATTPATSSPAAPSRTPSPTRSPSTSGSASPRTSPPPTPHAGRTAGAAPSAAGSSSAGGQVAGTGAAVPTR